MLTADSSTMMIAEIMIVFIRHRNMQFLATPIRTFELTREYSGEFVPVVVICPPLQITSSNALCRQQSVLWKWLEQELLLSRSLSYLALQPSSSGCDAPQEQLLLSSWSKSLDPELVYELSEEPSN